MNLDALLSLVSGAIWRAERLEDMGLETAASAWEEVSRFEEELAKLTPAKEPEGRIARRGAVRAALKANNHQRAQSLVERYLSERGTPKSLRGGFPGTHGSGSRIAGGAVSLRSQTSQTG